MSSEQSESQSEASMIVENADKKQLNKLRSVE